MKKNNISDIDYQKKIKEEARFWDERAEVLSSSGRIPLWFDLRRGEDVTFIPLQKLKGAGIRANPALYKIIYADVMHKILKEAVQKKGHVLDLGCGAGALSLELARSGMKVDGFDISPKQIEIAMRFSKESQDSTDPFLYGNFGSTNYQIVDLNHIALEKEKYEAVVSIGTLHHIQFLDHLIEEVYNSLKPDGKFIIYEYIGYSGLSRIFLPLLKALRFYSRFKDRIMHIPQEEKTSPFEGVTDKAIIELVTKRFSILRQESKFLFLTVLVPSIGIHKLPDYLSVPLVKILHLIDRALIGSRLFQGPYVFFIAKKK